jgi:hypothetical protein
VESDMSDWAGTSIEFKLSERAEGTTVMFRHAGYGDDIANLPYYSMSWAVFLLGLKELLERGEGFPFPNKWIDF